LRARFLGCLRNEQAPTTCRGVEQRPWAEMLVKD
jgi:hypothetical protein